MHFLTVILFAAAMAAPSRPAFEGCKWELLSDKTLGLDAWVLRCDFKSRKTDFIARGKSLVMRYSDAEKPEPVIDVVDLQPGETAEAAMTRFFRAHTDKAIASRCVLAPYASDEKPPKGVHRFTFSPNAAFAKEIEKKRLATHDDGIPDPPCGDYGETADSVEYWETQTGAHHVMFVRAGQDDPLFDEKTLRLH